MSNKKSQNIIQKKKIGLDYVFFVKNNIPNNNYDFSDSFYEEISKKYNLCKKVFKQNEKSHLFFDQTNKDKIIKSEWIASRAALLILIDYFLSIENLNGTLSLSISHTKDSAVAAGIVSKNIDGIGVDIENCSRKISNNLIDRIKNPSDIHLSNRHHIWNIKEAVFKNCSLNNQKSILDVIIKKKMNRSLVLASNKNENFLVKVFKFEDLSFALSIKKKTNTYSQNP